jgi:hypothetical protein
MKKPSRRGLFFERGSLLLVDHLPIFEANWNWLFGHFGFYNVLYPVLDNLFREEPQNNEEDEIENDHVSPFSA